jgi:hypothetical protein
MNATGFIRPQLLIPGQLVSRLGNSLTNSPGSVGFAKLRRREDRPQSASQSEARYEYPNIIV